MSSKRCFKCGEEKPLTEFYKHSGMADGHLNKCKQCAKQDAAKHRAENIDRLRAYDKQRATDPARKQRASRIVRRWREENPDRRRAQVLLGNAVRSGRVRPHLCWVCGCKAEAHHPDYSRPLDVVWLCPPHHKQTHALIQKSPTT